MGRLDIGFINPKDCDLVQYIVDGVKTVEGRRKTEKIEALQKGDIIMFRTKPKNIECVVVAVRHYKTFDDYLNKEKLKNYMPCVKTVEEAKKIYESFYKGKPIEGEYTAIEIKFKRQIFYRGVHEPWFTHIKNGVKKVEGRLNIGSFKSVKKGDIIVWINNKNLAKTEVIDIAQYKTFKDMLEKNKKKIQEYLPGAESVDEGIKIYRQYYREDDEKRHGVVALHLKRID